MTPIAFIRKWKVWIPESMQNEFGDNMGQVVGGLNVLSDMSCYREALQDAIDTLIDIRDAHGNGRKN